MQIANSFDPVTRDKIKKSALIAGGGFLVSVIPMFLPQILSALSSHPMAASAITAFSTWAISAIRSYLAGQPQV